MSLGSFSIVSRAVESDCKSFSTCAMLFISSGPLEALSWHQSCSFSAGKCGVSDK